MAEAGTRQVRLVLAPPARQPQCPTWLMQVVAVATDRFPSLEQILDPFVKIGSGRAGGQSWASCSRAAAPAARKSLMGWHQWRGAPPR